MSFRILGELTAMRYSAVNRTDRAAQLTELRSTALSTYRSNLISLNSVLFKAHSLSLFLCAPLLVNLSITGIKTQSVFNSVHFAAAVAALVAALFSLLCVCVCVLLTAKSHQLCCVCSIAASTLRGVRASFDLFPRDRRLTFSLNVFQYFSHALPFPRSLPNALLALPIFST